jgi:hypothetical protein
MSPPLLARTSFGAEVAANPGFEVAAVYGRPRRPRAILIDRSRTCSATGGRLRRRIDRCLKSPAHVPSISATGPSKTALLYQSRDAVIVSAPHHEPPSLVVATLAIAASLLHNGLSHESIHE